MLTEKRFTCRANTHPLGKLFVSSVCDPRNLGRKAFNMILFLFKQAFGNKHRQIYVFMPKPFKFRIKRVLNVFPYRIGIRAENAAALYACIFNQLRFFYNVGIPTGEILIH